MEEIFTMHLRLKLVPPNKISSEDENKELLLNYLIALSEL